MAGAVLVVEFVSAGAVDGSRIVAVVEVAAIVGGNTNSNYTVIVLVIEGLDTKN